MNHQHQPTSFLCLCLVVSLVVGVIVANFSWFAPPVYRFDCKSDVLLPELPETLPPRWLPDPADPLLE